MSLQAASRTAGIGVTLIRRIVNEAPPGAVNLGLGQSDMHIPQSLRDGLRAAAELRSAPYGPNAGDATLRDDIARLYDVPSAQVLVTVGVEEGIALTMFGLVNPGDEVVCPDPGFPVYANLATMTGATVRTYRLRPERRFRLTVDDLEPVVSSRTRLVVLCSPSNPTGAVCEPAEWERIAAFLARLQVPYLSDEIYLALQPPQRRHGSMWRHNRLGIVASGLSKSHGVAGWRLGWLIVPPELVAPFTALHQHWVTSAATVLQAAARDAFTPAIVAEIEAYVQTLQRRRARVEAELIRHGWEVCAGDGAFYLLIRLPGVNDDLALARFLAKEAAVITIPGQAFGDGARGYLRLSYAVDDAVLEQAVARLVAAAERFPRAGGER